MNKAKKYLKDQLANPEFKHSYLEEKAKLNIEYQLEELKRDIQSCKPTEELIQKVDRIEQFVMSV
jgi:polyhydroxyalkanoate synthesis regulator phasin